MKLIFNLILNRINHLHSISITKNLKSNYDSVSLLQFDKNNCNTFKNSRVEIDYILIKNQLHLKFDKPTSLLAIEYLCDINSGLIEISSNKNCIQKNTLKDEPFILIHKKSMITAITFNKFEFDKDNEFMIKIISPKEKNKSIFDEERITSDQILTENFSFKITSLLITNDAKIKLINNLY